MTDFYEELADFAAMSEDDGFLLGHCAGASPHLPALSIEAGKSGECWIAPARRSPRQLQLLVVLERTTRTF